MATIKSQTNEHHSYIDDANPPHSALIQNESEVKELGDTNLRELAQYVTEQFRTSTQIFHWNGDKCAFGELSG